MKVKAVKKNRCDRRRKAGFTLVEMLVAMAIMLLFTLIMSSLMNTATLAYKQSISTSNADVFVSNAVNELRHELSDARNVQAVTGADFVKQKNQNAPKVTFETGGYTVKSGVLYTDSVTGAECLIFINEATKTQKSTIMISKYGEVHELVGTTDDLTISYNSVSIKNNTVVFSGIKAVKDEKTYSSISEFTVKLK